MSRSSEAPKARASRPARRRAQRNKPATKIYRKALTDTLLYKPQDGVDAYVLRVHKATPFELVQLERTGVPGRYIKDLSARIRMPATTIFRLLGLPKATISRKVSGDQLVSGSGGQAAVALTQLLGIAQEVVASSTAAEAEGFDTAQWFGEWIERPQPSLGGQTPAELLGTPTGFDLVARLLRSLASGSYQ